MEEESVKNWGKIRSPNEESNDLENEILPWRSREEGREHRLLDLQKEFMDMEIDKVGSSAIK